MLLLTINILRIVFQLLYGKCCKLCLGQPPYKAPRIMWTSHHRETALKGQSKKLKCIFAG